jgi:type I restriction enzyme R subunit
MPPPAAEEAEWPIRKQRVDRRLAAAGWTPRPLYSGLSEDIRPAVVEEYSTENGPADYAFFVEGRALAIVEAKRLSLSPQNVLTQAERYARGLNGNPFDFDGLPAPFLYSTNGEIIWFHDVRHVLNRSRLTQAIPAKAFHGELVPTEAELDRREGRDYESATELLRRIKEEQARAQQPPRRGRMATRRPRPAVLQAKLVWT